MEEKKYYVIFDLENNFLGVNENEISNNNDHKSILIKDEIVIDEGLKFIEKYTIKLIDDFNVKIEISENYTDNFRKLIIKKIIEEKNRQIQTIPGYIRKIFDKDENDKFYEGISWLNFYQTLQNARTEYIIKVFSKYEIDEDLLLKKKYADFIIDRIKVIDLKSDGLISKIKEINVEELQNFNVKNNSLWDNNGN